MNWDLLIYLLEYFSIREMCNLNFHNARCIMLLEEDSEDAPGMVYVYSDAPSGRFFLNALLICAGSSNTKRAQKISNNYIFTKAGTAAEVLNRLLKTQAHLNDLSAQLSSVHTNQEAVEIAYARTGTPYFYFEITNIFCLDIHDKTNEWNLEQIIYSILLYILINSSMSPLY